MARIDVLCLFIIGMLLPRAFLAGDIVCHDEFGRKGTCCHPQYCRSNYFYSRHCGYYAVCCPHDVIFEEINHLTNQGLSTIDHRKKKKTTTVRQTRTSPVVTVVNPSTAPNLRIKGCGVRRTLTDFVIGGRKADYWPWMATIYIRPRGARTSRFNCGGTVISKKFILTAAHCLFDGSTPMTANRVSVRVGGPTTLGDGQVYRIAVIVTHRKYKPNVHYDDIALLRLSEDIRSKNVAPACLPSSGMYNANFYQRNGTIIGWGLTTVDGQMSDILQEAQVPIVPNKRCNSSYANIGSLSLPNGITETQICAGTKDGSKDACQGDSGGPLLVPDKSGKWTVVGIVSFGYGCAEPDYPGVYTRVPKYLYWLKDNTDIASSTS